MAMELKVRINRAHKLGVLCLAYDALKRQLWSGGRDCTIKAWRTDGTLIKTCARVHQGHVMDLVFAQDLHLLFSAGLDRRLVVWTDEGTQVQVLELGSPASCLLWVPKAPLQVTGAAAEEVRHLQRLFVGGRGEIYRFKIDVDNVERAANMHRHAAAAAAAAAGLTSAPSDRTSPTSITRAPPRGPSAAGDPAVPALSLQILLPEGVPMKGPSDMDSTLTSALVMAANNMLLATLHDGRLLVLDLDMHRPPHVMVPPGPNPAGAPARPQSAATLGLSLAPRLRLTGLATDAAGSLAITGRSDGAAHTWSSDGHPQGQFQMGGKGPCYVGYCEATTSFWATGAGNAAGISVYDSDGRVNLTPYVAEISSLTTSNVTRLSCPTDSVVLGINATTRQLLMWEYSESLPYRTFAGKEQVCCLCVVEGIGAEFVVTGGAYGGVTVWELDSTAAADVYIAIDHTAAHSSAITCLVYCPDLDCLVSGCTSGGMAKITASLQSPPDITALPMKSARNSFKPGSLSTPSPRSSPRHIKPTTGTSKHFTGHAGGVAAVALLPGWVCASVGNDGSVRLTDLYTLQLLRSCDAVLGGAAVACMAYSPLLAQLALCGEGDVEATIVDVVSLQDQGHRLRGSQLSIMQVCWIVSRELWAASTASASVFMWDGTGEHVQTVTVQGPCTSMLVPVESIDSLMVGRTDGQCDIISLADMACAMSYKCCIAEHHPVCGGYMPSRHMYITAGTDGQWRKLLGQQGAKGLNRGGRTGNSRLCRNEGGVARRPMSALNKPLNAYQPATSGSSDSSDEDADDKEAARQLRRRLSVLMQSPRALKQSHGRGAFTGVLMRRNSANDSRVASRLGGGPGNTIDVSGRDLTGLGAELQSMADREAAKHRRRRCTVADGRRSSLNNRVMIDLARHEIPSFDL